MVLTYRYRIKDATSGQHLRRQALEVNRVWNYCGEVQSAARRHNRRWPSGFDLINLTSGSSKLLGLHSDTVQAVCKQFAISRDACGKRPRWRGRKSLGWVPFQAPRAIRLQGNMVVFLRRRYHLWLSRPIDGRILCGSFAEDARHRWYLNLQVEVPQDSEHGVGEIGIDLGLKSLAVLSAGEVIEAPRIYRKHERELDAGWSQLRSQIRYKAVRHGAEYIEVDERFSTQVCSACGVRGGPQGREDLVVREWSCSGCGARHDRDINSAINILFSGRNVGLHQTEIPSLRGRR